MDIRANETVDKLYEEMDFQRAVQAYLWAIPLVSFAQWQQEHENVFGAKDGDLVYYVSYRDKLGLLTSNATTPYLLGFPTCPGPVPWSSTSRPDISPAPSSTSGSGRSPTWG